MGVYRLPFMEKELKLNIKRVIKEKGLTINEVCKKMNQDRKFLYRITGKVSLQKIIDVSRAIGCNVSELTKDL